MKRDAFPRYRRLALGLRAALLTVLLAGCGGGGGSASAPGPNPKPAAHASGATGTTPTHTSGAGDATLATHELSLPAGIYLFNRSFRTGNKPWINWKGFFLLDSAGSLRGWTTVRSYQGQDTGPHGSLFTNRSRLAGPRVIRVPIPHPPPDMRPNPGPDAELQLRISEKNGVHVLQAGLRYGAWKWPNMTANGALTIGATLKRETTFEISDRARSKIDNIWPWPANLRMVLTPGGDHNVPSVLTVNIDNGWMTGTLRPIDANTPGLYNVDLRFRDNVQHSIEEPLRGKCFIAEDGGTMKLLLSAQSGDFFMSLLAGTVR